MFSGANLAVPFVVPREIPGMIPLLGAVCCFAVVQACIFAFFVTLLIAEFGFSLTVAGAAFAAMQVTGVFSRVIMGWLADRLGCVRALLLLAAASAIMAFVLSRVGPDWPTWLVMGVGVFIGLTCISWNGIYLAEVARMAPPGRVGEATSGAVFWVFASFSLAPFLFTTGVTLIGSYSPCFVVVAGVQTLAIPPLLLINRNRQK